MAILYGKDFLALWVFCQRAPFCKGCKGHRSDRGTLIDAYYCVFALCFGNTPMRFNYEYLIVRDPYLITL